MQRHNTAARLVTESHQEGFVSMTIEEIELACEESKATESPRHPLEVSEPEFESIFYPLGFPVVLRSNAPEIISLAKDFWSAFSQQFWTTPIRVDVHVEEGGSLECPPAPNFRIAQPLLMNIADSHNYSISNIESMTTQVVLSRGTLRHT